MFLLITGASGVGKSTVRRRVEGELASVLEAAELAELGRTPRWSLAWRHQAVEAAVQRAIRLQAEGKHFLLCGDPVPPGEVLAAPSGDRLEGIAVCLLDASEEAQRSRLIGRGDDPVLLPNHVAFAAWMRGHVADPAHRPEVIMRTGWEEMRWERWVPGDGRMPWTHHVIDTSDLRPDEVARLASAWIRRTIGLGEAPEGRSS